MKKVIMNNGITLLYKHIDNNLTSFSIAFEAGANVESNEELGLAHVVEHMLFKGTKKRNEEEINISCDELFGFNNAMTNYPYVVYYGTSLSTDFKEAFELYSDIILNPSFPEHGFEEEIKVICEELKEWKDEPAQHCEDSMFYNAFQKRRIKELIIGKEEVIKSFTIDIIKKFYNTYYTADNCVISVISSLPFEEVNDIIHEIYGLWNKKLNVENSYISGEVQSIYETNQEGIFYESKEGLQGAKIQYSFPIHNLSNKEIKALRIFNVAFGEGTSSILYNEIRTKQGLVYDISSEIKNEKGIKIFKISLGTSKVNIEKATEIINNKINEVKNYQGYFTEMKIEKIAKGIKLKKTLALERSIQESVSTAVYEIMYRSSMDDYSENNTTENYLSPLYEQINDLDHIKEEDIIKVINKVLVKPTIQVLTPKVSE